MASKQHFILTAAPVEVDEIIRKHIYKDKDCVIYTAGNALSQKQLRLLSGIVGLNQLSFPDSEKSFSKKIEFKSIPSPFSPDAVTIIVPEDAVSGRYDNKKPG